LAVIKKRENYFRDTEYDDFDLTRQLGGILSEGVVDINDTTDNFTEYSSTGLVLKLRPGAAYVGGDYGFFIEYTAENINETIDLTFNTAAISRRDYVVLQIDRDNKTIDVVIVENPNASSTTLPTLEQDMDGTGIYQMGLYSILVEPATITVTDVRTYAGTTGAAIFGGATLSTDGAFTLNLDTLVPTEKASKTYITGQVGVLNTLTTTSKTNIVSAVNEVVASVSTLSGDVINKVLTGLNTSLTGNVVEGDTVLQAFGRLEHRVNLNDSKVTNTDTQLSNSQVIGMVLTGLNTSLTGNVVEGDTVLQAFGRLEHRVNLNDSKVTNTDTQLDSAGVVAKVLTGFTVATTASDISSSDTILTAFQKMEYRIRTNDDKVTNTDTQLTNSQVTGMALTGFTVATTASDISSSDTIREALQKMEYRIRLNDDKVSGSSVDVLNTVLTGFEVATTASDISNTDKVLEAFEKIDYRVRLNDDKVSDVNHNTDTQLTSEQVQDIVAPFIVGGTAITVTYNDTSDTLTLSNDYATPGTGSNGVRGAVRIEVVAGELLIYTS